MTNLPDVKDFMLLVDKEGPLHPVLKTRCHLWTGTILSKGYGQARMNGRRWRAHRLAYAILVGVVSDDIMVLHKCDNRKCVNPDHLFLGDHLTNMKDMTVKGRQAKGDRHYSVTQPWAIARGDRHGSRVHPEKRPKGELHGSAVLTECDVIEIRRRYAVGETQRSLARQFGVHQRSVYRIVNRLTWTHV